MAIPLGRVLPPASSDLPGRQLENSLFAPANRAKGRPYLVLLQVGFVLPLPLPAARCALTAPFHPYRRQSTRRFVFCDTFPGVAPAGSYPAPCFRGARTFLCPNINPSSGHPAI